MGIEHPSYKIAIKEGPFEVRCYPSCLFAEVVVSGDREAAEKHGLHLLKRFGFGGKPQHQTLPATASMAGSADAEDWIIRFAMPRALSLEALPSLHNPDVRLTEAPPARCAVIRFSGLASPLEIEERLKRLQGFITGRNLSAIGPAALARYNPPWVPGFLRRNEVILPIA